ncbi:MAG TPA: APC family permease, partial [Chloroflexota bacterium]|nr:APC family permease [Chloroflexota bacterium]
PPSPQPHRLREVVRNVPEGGAFVGPIRPAETPPGGVVPRPGRYQARHGFGRVVASVYRLLIGPPLATWQEREERVGKLKALAIFASDNISSSAYATEEIMRVLILAGIGALALTMPITLALIALIVVVALSYFQVIRAHPEGGGSYQVARTNLGPLAGLTAAAALLIDYILTVAVSTAAGIAALTSAFPSLYADRVIICVLVIVLMMILNLRGIRESGSVFAAPTYLYVVSILGVIGFGLYKTATGQLPTLHESAWAASYAQNGAFEVLTAFLVLRAFASGAVALTGLEAVSNGVPAFKPPEVRNAQITLATMAVLFAVIFFGVSFLAGRMHVVPDPTQVETVNSQVARTVLGTNIWFYLVQFFTSLILVLAANTAFNGFPRLAGILARDRYLPRSFEFRGDRLAFTTGIVVLALIAALLIVLFQASVTALIPLYTIGVFVAFTLSQVGLVKHWLRVRGQEPGWRWRMAVNALGALATGVVLLIVAVTKFALGAWMVLILLPLFIWTMFKINQHYRRIACAAVPETPLVPAEIHTHIVIPVSEINIPARQAVAFGEAICHAGDVVAVHVADSPEAAEEFRRAWRDASLGAPLVIVESPYRSLVAPLLAYVEAFRDQYPRDPIMVILPEYVSSHWWEHLLHNQTALRLKAALLFYPGVVVASVPYHLGTLVPGESCEPPSPP